MKSIVLLLSLSALAIVLSLKGNPNTIISNTQPINQQPSIPWQSPWTFPINPWEFAGDYYDRPYRRHRHHHHHHGNNNNENNNNGNQTENDNNNNNNDPDDGNGINDGDGNVGNIGEDNSHYPYDPTFPSIPPVPVVIPPVVVNPPIIPSPFPEQPGNNASPNQCRISGVYRHMCIPKNLLVAAETNKKFKYHFTCYSDAICGYKGGRCQWFATPKFKQCMQDAKFFTIKNGITKSLVVNPETFA